MVVIPPSDAIDKRSASLSSERPRSAAFALQDHLNASDDALWGLASNGHILRLMRDNASLTRPAYIEANLAQIFATDDMASFSALWLLIHRLSDQGQRRDARILRLSGGTLGPFAHVKPD